MEEEKAGTGDEELRSKSMARMAANLERMRQRVLSGETVAIFLLEIGQEKTNGDPREINMIFESHDSGITRGIAAQAMMQSAIVMVMEERDEAVTKAVAAHEAAAATKH